MKKNKIIALSALIMGITTNAFSSGLLDDVSGTVVDFNGLMEAVYKENNASDKKREIFVDTLELNVSKHINDNFDFNILFLAEADDNGDLSSAPIVDEAILKGKFEKFNFSLGKLDAPFGLYSNALISSPAGKAIGKTIEHALVLSKVVDQVNYSAWIGLKDENNSGLSVRYKTDDYMLGVDVITDALGVEDGESSKNINNRGVAIYGKTSWKGINFVAEQISVNVEGADNKKETQFEASYALSDWNFAIRRDNGDTQSNVFGVDYKITDAITASAQEKLRKEDSNTSEFLLVYKF